MYRLFACALAILAACDDSSALPGDTPSVIPPTVAPPTVAPPTVNVPAGRLPAASEDKCGANSLAYLLGEPYQFAQSVPALPANSRIYGLGDAITMDYSEVRLNVVYDSDGIVQRLFCG